MQAFLCVVNFVHWFLVLAWRLSLVMSWHGFMPHWSAGFFGVSSCFFFGHVNYLSCAIYCIGCKSDIIYTFVTVVVRFSRSSFLLCFLFLVFLSFLLPSLFRKRLVYFRKHSSVCSALSFLWSTSVSFPSCITQLCMVFAVFGCSKLLLYSFCKFRCTTENLFLEFLFIMQWTLMILLTGISLLYQSPWRQSFGQA